MTDIKNWITVVAPEGRLPETIRELLALADDPSHVRTQGNRDLIVAPYVADRLNRPKRAPRKSTRKESGS